MAVDLGIDDALETIAKAVGDGQCILFLGAAAHAGPPHGSPFAYPPQHRPPMGRDLSRALATECGLTDHYEKEDPHNLPRVALFYELGRSRAKLVDAVQAAVQDDKQPSPMLRGLAELDFSLVITTNYDDLFEQALVEAGKEPQVSIYSLDDWDEVDLTQLTPQRPIVFKIHGDIFHRQTLVITDDDYIEFVRMMSDKDPRDPIPLELKELLMTQTTLFVGYSLRDYNLRLLFQMLRWKRDRAMIPDMYCVDRRPDPLVRDVWQDQRRHVRFVVENVWTFVPDLYRRVTGEELQP